MNKCPLCNGRSVLEVPVSQFGYQHLHGTVYRAPDGTYRDFAPGRAVLIVPCGCCSSMYSIQNQSSNHGTHDTR